MKPLIIYCSRTENTAGIAKIISDTLGADCSTVEEIQKNLLKDRKLIGLGSGIYNMRHDKKLFKVVKTIPSTCKVFIFTTSGSHNKYYINFAQYWLKRKLKKKGIEIVGIWNCPGHDKNPGIPFRWIESSKGRPNGEDNKNASRFAEKLIRYNNKKFY